MLLEELYIYEKLGRDNLRFEGKSILICGSEGFLGTLLQKYFDFINKEVLRNKCKIYCVDIIDTKPKYDNFVYQKCNISDGFDITSSFTPDYVINLSGRASPPNYAKHKLETFRVSVEGTENVLNYILKVGGVESYLGFSSSEVYGNPLTVPTPESCLAYIDPVGKRASYDISKAAIETLCTIYHEDYGVNTKIIRFFNSYGFMNAGDGRVIPNFFSKILSGQKIQIYKPGIQTRTFCWYADSLIGLIKVLLNGDNKPYNIGNDKDEINMMGLADKVQRICGYTDRVELVDGPEVYTGEPMRRRPDISRAKKDLGYFPEINLDEGLKKFYKWAKENYEQ